MESQSIKNMERSKENIWDMVKSLTNVIWGPEREERENGIEVLFEVTIARNFPKETNENKP